MNCSVCQTKIKKNEPRVISQNKEIIICKDCIDVAYWELNPTKEKSVAEQLLEKLYETQEGGGKQTKKSKEISERTLNYYPRDINNLLNDYVIGQDETKKVLSVAIYKHLQTLKKDKKIENHDKEMNKSNILLIGDSGSGKTLFAETIAKILEVPLVISDASHLTTKGYVGGDVDEMLQNLLIKSDMDIDTAERGIIFIDEIDKISSKQTAGSKTKDPTGAGVQENLLKIIEGAEIQLKMPPRTPSHQPFEVITLNTKNILFIFGGAFSGLEELMTKKETKMGFEISKGTTIEEDQNKLLDYILEYGFSPEFLGRIPVISQLNKLTSDDLLKIITKPKNSILKQYEHFFEKHNSQIIFDDEALREIVKQIENNKIGARALKKIFEKMFLEIIYDMKGFENKQIFITKEYVQTNDIKYIITKDYNFQGEQQQGIEI